MKLFRNKKDDVQELDTAKKASAKRSSAIDNEITSLSGDIGSIDIVSDKKETKQKKMTPGDFVASLIKKKKPESIPDSTQKCVPYRHSYLNGIIENTDGCFTKCYRLTDVNFRTARDDKQADMFDAYKKLLNVFTPDIRAQFVIWNSTIDREEFNRTILYKPTGEDYDDLRQDINSILYKKSSEGLNSIRQEKYLVVSVKADNIEIANSTFKHIDNEIATRIKDITEYTAEPMSLEARLELLYNIYNQDSDTHFFERMEINGQEARSFDVSWMLSQGLSTKDLIAPDVLQFKDDHFKVNDKVGRCLYLRNLPTQLSADVLADISLLPCNALTSVHVSPILQDDATKLVRNQMLEVTRNMTAAAKKNAGKGLGPEFLSPDLYQEKKGAEKFYDDLTEGDEKAFLLTLVVTVFADDLEDLEKYTNIVKNAAKAKLCRLDKLSMQQENGLRTSVPLGINRIWADRLLNTTSTALFMPFESQELFEADGIYYGLNGTSKNCILYDRRTAQNPNGLILGIPGSGKSMSAKSEMAQVFLRDRKNEIFVIDPQGEYKPLCEKFGGTVIRIAPSTSTYINPFDCDVSPEANDGNDPLRMKSSYICSICEKVIGGQYGLNPIHETIIDRVVRKIYEPYLRYMDQQRENGSEITCDPSKAPTLIDFYHELERQDEPEADYIRLAMEKYCIGSYTTFAHRTNIDVNNRFIVYDIKDIGTGMMEMGMQVCLNDIWNRTIANKKKGIRTWIYVDEMYLLTESASCAKFLEYIYRQARKFGGIPTGITQNVEDLLKNSESRALLNNCPFLLLHNQQEDDRAEIGKKLSISDAQLDYIKNADSGQGLLYTGKVIVPFINRIPQDSLLYATISTNPNEVKA